MNSKIVIALFFSTLGLTANLCAQSSVKQIPQNDVTGKRLEEGMNRANSKRTMSQTTPVEPQEIGVKKSQYNFKEKEILAKLNTESIPTDFPVYKSEYTEEEYTSLMNKWYTANPSLVKKGNNQQ